MAGVHADAKNPAVRVLGDVAHESLAAEVPLRAHRRGGQLQFVIGQGVVFCRTSDLDHLEAR